MGERQPDMQGHKPGLGAGAEQGEPENGRRPPAVWRHKPHRCKSQIGGWSEERDRRNKADRPKSGHADIEKRRATWLCLLMPRQHHRPGGERHKLKAQHDPESIGRQQSKGHRSDKDWEKRPGPRLFRRMRLGGVYGAGSCRDEQNEQKKTRKRIEFEGELAARRADRQGDESRPRLE